MIAINTTPIEFMLRLVNGQTASYKGRVPADLNNKYHRGSLGECKTLVMQEHNKPDGLRFMGLLGFYADSSTVALPFPVDWPSAPLNRTDEQSSDTRFNDPPINIIKPDLSEARRLLDMGVHLVRLKPHSKQPEGEGWNKPEARASSIDPDATGYGMMLSANNRCSIDPDNWSLAVIGMRALGFDLPALMECGVRTKSTRKGSGGRSGFNAEPDLSWLTFASYDPAIGTVIEFRADSPNLQDAVPGVVYRTKEGEVCTQFYAGDRRLDDPPPLPDNLLAWWQRCSIDIDFLREQQRIFMGAIGTIPIQSISTGRKGDKLAYPAPAHRQNFNEAHKVQELIEKHGYCFDKKNGRWYPPTATGAPSVREIPGKDGLWQSDHASDPLRGTFDAWTAYVVLDHHGDVEAAKKAFDVDCGLAHIDISGILNQMSKPRQEVTEGVRSDYSGLGNTIHAPGQESGHSGLNTTRSIDLDSCIVNLTEQASADSIHPHVIEQLVPIGEVTLLAGHGAAGKSYIALLLCIFVALGLSFDHLKVQRKKVLFFSAEDDKSELLRRVAKICRSIDVDQSDLVDWLCLIDASEIDPTLYQVNKKDEHLHTQILEKLDVFVRRCDFGLVVIDNASDVFNGNEIMRAHVRGFIRTLRQRLARPERAVILLAHVSKTAAHNRRSQSAATDEDYSGSTAWHNSVRSRLSLDTDDKGTSTLKHLKANKGPKADPIRLEWHNGAPTVAGIFDYPGAALADSLHRAAEKQQNEADKNVIVKIISDFDRRGERLTTSMQGSVTVFKALNSVPEFPKNLTKERVNIFMRELERDGRVFRVRKQTPNRKWVDCFSCTRDASESAPNPAVDHLNDQVEPSEPAA